MRGLVTPGDRCENAITSAITAAITATAPRIITRPNGNVDGALCGWPGVSIFGMTAGSRLGAGDVGVVCEAAGGVATGRGVAAGGVVVVVAGGTVEGCVGGGVVAGPSPTVSTTRLLSTRAS